MTDTPAAVAPKAKRTRKAKVDPTVAIRASFMGANTPADAARVIDANPKALRSVLRSQGTRVRQGDAFDDKAKATLFDSPFVTRHVAAKINAK